MTKSRLAGMFLVAAFCLPVPLKGADEERKSGIGQLQTELREVRKLLDTLSRRLDQMEERLGELEAERDSAHPEGRPPGASGLRPLGRYYVDECGIIWLDGRPVGFWGVRNQSAIGGGTPSNVVPPR